LSTGAIVVQQADLTITGAGINQLTIKRDPPSGKQRIFKHTGGAHTGGTLTLGYMTVSDGYYGNAGADAASGGCIYSRYKVVLDHVRVTNCQLVAKNAAIGGGVAADGGLTLRHSTLAGNSATVAADATYGAIGGGAFGTDLDASVSSIVDNVAVGSLNSQGGGLFVFHDAMLTASTISDNHTAGTGGGIVFKETCPPLGFCSGVATVINSTISGNSASLLVGGIYAHTLGLNISNSTIAFNTAYYGAEIRNGTFRYLAAGVAAPGGSVDLESSLLANNHYGTPPLDSDFSFYKLVQTDAVTGLNNLVREGHGAAPAGSMHGACPLLGPLRDNGGVTKTHALLRGSPGIDGGNNAVDVAYDQRLAPYNRENGFPDIGAYEIQPEIVFDAGFDGCVPLP
jgi:hypothetical protein